MGYSALIQRFDLRAIAPFRRSYIAEVGGNTVEKTADSETRIYASSYRPGAAVSKQLRFALRYEGVELGVLSELFQVIDPKEIEGWVREERTGQYSRRIWFLYEWLTGQELNLEDLDRGNYENAVDPKRYYTSAPVRSRRHRVWNNLPGSPRSVSRIAESAQHASDFRWLRCPKTPVTWKSSAGHCLRSSTTNWTVTG